MRLRSPRPALWRGVGLTAVVLLASYRALLVPGRVLAARDVPFLHLPLRAAFRDLVLRGLLPRWNPLLHGGDPILSNPHYSAFYPLTWLLLPFAPATALQLLVLLHAVWALLGAHRLLRRLGCGEWAAAFGAVAYAGGGPLVGLAGTLLVYTGMAWLPWILLWGEDFLALPAEAPRRQRVSAGAQLGLGFALQMLNGDPAAVMTTGLLLALLAVLGGRESPARRVAVRRVLGAAGLALLLAAVQFLPTWMRLRESVRGEGLSIEQATSWSTHPARLAEIAFPRLFGDPARDEEGLYFGWDLNDKQYPFLLSIAPGLLVLVLGAGALVAGGVRHRWVWTAGAGLGVFLGVGRFNPLYAALHAALPVLGMVRYPEKFLLLTTSCLAIAGGLGLERLLAERGTSSARLRRVTMGLALALIVVAVALLGWLTLAGASGEAFVRRHAAGPLSPRGVAAGLAYLRGQAGVTLALAAAVALWLALVDRVRALSAASLATLALALVLAEQAYYGRDLLPTMPREEFFAPPGVAHQVAVELATLPGPAARVATDAGLLHGPAMGLRIGRPGLQQMRGRIERFDPYSGNLWGFAYALHEDYDLMLTRWGRLAVRALHEAWPQPVAARHLLAAWAVGVMLHVRPPEELLADLRQGVRAPAPVRLEAIAALHRVRSVPRVTFHPDAGSAFAAAQAEGWDVGAAEHCVDAERATPQPVDYALDARVATADGGVRSDELGLSIDAPRHAFVVVATTYDDGWSATLDGAPLRLVPTAAGEIGFEVPLGRHLASLVYRDPWVGAGGALSAVAGLALLLAVLRARRLG